MSYKWIATVGEFSQQGQDIVFKGGTEKSPDGHFYDRVTNLVCDQTFGGGTISGQVKFVSSAAKSGCSFILYYDAPTRGFIMAGFGSPALCSIASFNGDRFVTHASIGDRSQLVPERSYDLKVRARGSSVAVSMDGVDILAAILPFPLPRGQVGLWFLSSTDIVVSNYTVTPESSRAFVVMQYGQPYDELYEQVIAPVCGNMGLIAKRVDESYGPGLIISDIAREINEAKVVVADITPANLNVYYEVGYAHALNKPTILVAEGTTKLPFDVSPFRVLLYENTIGGKARFEAGFRKHLTAIQNEWPAT